MANKDLDDRVAALESDLAALADRVAALESKPATDTPVADPSAPADLSSLTDRVTKLEVEVFPPVAENAGDAPATPDTAPESDTPADVAGDTPSA